MNQGMTRADLAARLDVAPATIRKWQAVFAGRLITPPGRRGENVALILDPADVRVLSAVAELRRAGYNLAETAARLDQHLATTPPTLLLPELRPIEETAAAVSPALYTDVLRALESAESAAATITEERDYLRGRIIELENRLMEEVAARAAAEERARAAGDPRPPSLWQRLTGRAAD